MADEFTFADVPPEVGNPIEVSTPEFTCEVCGVPIEYSGRGRKPKYCDEHKKSKSSTTPARKPVVDRAISELTMMYGMAGQGIKWVDPVIGEAIYEKRGDLAESYRLLLETNARFRKMFAEVESKAAWLPIIAVHGDLIASIWIGKKLHTITADDV